MPEIHWITQNIKIAKVKINKNKPISAIGIILNKYENKIRAISRSKAWHPLNLTKYGIFGFFTTPANKIKNNNIPPKGRLFSIIEIGKTKYRIIFK
tara:strand:+ start:190 stop:477 length:288 start_codon:yes stop_codon:yes gene_type:complete